MKVTIQDRVATLVIKHPPIGNELKKLLEVLATDPDVDKIIIDASGLSAAFLIALFGS